MESEFQEVSVENNNGKCYNYKGIIVAEEFKLIANAIENFEVRDDDVWICSFPRSGTTWTQEMIWNIVNDLDFEGAQIPIAERSPFLEYVRFEENPLQYIENIGKSPSPRFIKTHLPFHLLPRQLREQEKKSKIVYVSRNPKDVCISYYHLLKLVSRYFGDFEDFCKAFLEIKVYNTPYWNNVHSYYERRDNSNILLLEFEEMKKDLRSVIKKVAIFLDKTLTDQQINDLENHLSFGSMQKNPALNWENDFDQSKGKFIRSGKVDQWKTVMSKELINQFDDWIQANSRVL